MLNLKFNLKDFITRTFHDEILSADAPCEYKITYNDIGTRLEAYVVDVTYKYAGKRQYFFAIDNDHLQLISPARALKNANDFYARCLKKVKLDTAKVK